MNISYRWLRDLAHGIPDSPRGVAERLAMLGAPVDEIVPMLFRMQLAGERLRKRLAQGHDFRNPRCRA